jgi:hypothetical protein
MNKQTLFHIKLIAKKQALDFNQLSDIFKKQLDASCMLETLISDLLDLASIENNQFKL